MNNFYVSLFEGLSKTQPKQVGLEEVLNLIRWDERVCARTQLFRQYRQEGNEEAAAREKLNAPCISVSVLFEGGKARKHVVGWTGVGMVDIDHILPEKRQSVWEKVKQAPYTWVAFRTISNEGVRVLFRYNGLTDDFALNEKVHALAFQEVNAYYAKLTGCDTDGKCKNATRLTVLAHDAEVWLNEKARVCDYVKLQHHQEEEKRKRKLEKRKKTDLNLAIKVAMQELEKRQVVYEKGSHNEYVSQLGYLLNEFGVDREVAMEWAGEHFVEYPQAASVVKSCYQKVDRHGTRSLKEAANARIISIDELEGFLNKVAHFRKNVISGFTEIAYLEEPEVWKDLTDREVNSLWVEVNRQEKPCPIGNLRQVLESKFVPEFHPFKTYLEQCPAWDGVTDYIDDLAATLQLVDEEESRFFHHYFKKWFVSMVAALVNEETVNNGILVLIGPQGIYKTTWLGRLLPPELRRYFNLKSDSSRFSKDDHLALTEFAIICLEELENMEGALMTHVKALTTMSQVVEQAPYARYKLNRPHTASFVGTSNYRHFLFDLEGTRRWLPVEVTTIQNPYEWVVPYGELYGQARALIEQGYEYWLNNREIAEVNLHNQNFEMPCLERDLILTYFRVPMPGEEAEFLTNAEILVILNAGLRHLLSATRVGILMAQAGFKPVKVAGKRGYQVIRLRRF